MSSVFTRAPSAVPKKLNLNNKLHVLYFYLLIPTGCLNSSTKKNNGIAQRPSFEYE